MIDSQLTSATMSASRTTGQTEAAEATLRNAAQAGDRKGVRDAAETFEAQFLSQMLNHMMKGLGTDGMFGGGQAEQIWRDLYVQEVSDVIARRGGIGVTETIERQLLKLQEIS